MLPKRKMNIYKKNTENVQSIIDFYFRELDLDLEGSMDFLIEEKQNLELNQIEFISRKIREAYYEIFKLNLNGRISLKNLLNYAIMTLTEERSNWNGSKSRLKIAEDFFNFVKKTETDIGFLERNN
ncbi:hypothetical protein [Olleya sp. ITB9]|uniref:hypothetical protein n=1 Tax=Olleya sp. ITB9 TaxID=1715648 RepID=UPI0006D16525|nr:hypothetical protein [Olleya sp. ITB9]